MEISSKITFLFIIYFAFAPRVQNYMFLLSKDVFYVAFVMLNLMMFYNLIKGKHDKKYYISYYIIESLSYGRVYRYNIKIKFIQQYR